MKTKHFLSALTAIVMAFTFSSCNTGDDVFQYSNYVTYLGTSSGMPAVSWQGLNDSESITLLLNVDPSALLNLTRGTRLFLAFETEATELVNNMTVTPIQLGVITTLAPITGSVTPPEGWSEEPQLYISAIFRSGPYINMLSLLPSGTEDDKFSMEFYVDPQTLGQENVVGYLSYTNPAAGTTVPNIYTYMNCIDINSLMNGTTKTLTINFNNGNPDINAYYEGAGKLSKDKNSISIPLM